MKNVIYIAAILSFFSHSEEVCWEVTPATTETAPATTETAQTTRTTGAEVSLLAFSKKVVCFDFDDTPESIVINQGGGCGGSSKCGFNFLILDDLIYKFNKRIDALPPELTPIHLGPINFYKKYNIYTNVKDAQLFLEQRQNLESVMLSENLGAGINSWKKYNLPKKVQNSPFDIFKETSKSLKIKNKPNSSISIEQFDLSKAQIIQIKNSKKIE